MCFDSAGSTPAPPPQQPAAPPPQAPARPRETVTAAPTTLTIDRQMGVKKQKSSKEVSGQVSKGTSQLRVPLNIGTPKSGGLNI